MNQKTNEIQNRSPRHALDRPTVFVSQLPSLTCEPMPFLEGFYENQTANVDSDSSLLRDVH